MSAARSLAACTLRDWPVVFRKQNRKQRREAEIHRAGLGRCRPRQTASKRRVRWADTVRADTAIPGGGSQRAVAPGPCARARAEAENGGAPAMEPRTLLASPRLPASPPRYSARWLHGPSLDRICASRPHPRRQASRARFTMREKITSDSASKAPHRN